MQQEVLLRHVIDVEGQVLKFLKRLVADIGYLREEGLAGIRALQDVPTPDGL